MPVCKEPRNRYNVITTVTTQKQSDYFRQTYCVLRDLRNTKYAIRGLIMQNWLLAELFSTTPNSYLHQAKGTAMAVKTKIIKIGNSRGVRIPKPFLEQLDFSGEVEIAIQDNQLVLRPISPARKNWDTAFAQMAARGDDRLPDETPATKWDETEWAW